MTKVLATSKLASKVRSKIKEKKTKEAEDARNEAEEAKNAAEKAESEKTEPISDVQSNFEVGSVEHYKELTKQK